MRFFIAIILMLTSIAIHAQEVLRSVDSLLLDNQTTLATKLLNDALSTTNNTLHQNLIRIKKAEVLIQAQANTLALEELQQVEKLITTPLELAYFKSVKGQLELYQGRNDLAEKNLQSAYTLLTENNADNTLAAAQTITTLGLVFYNTGKYAQAEEQLMMALSIRLKLLSEKHELIAASYNNLGLVYSQSDPDKALTYYEKALPIYESLHGKAHAKIAINNTNTGVIYRNLELYGDAINNLENALNIWQKIISKPDPRKAFVLYQLGYTYQQMKNNSSAEEYYKKALEEYKKCYGQKHPDIAGLYNALGNLAKTKSQYQPALSYYHQALKSNLTNFEHDELNKLPTLLEYYSGNYLLYSLMYKAQCFEALYFGKTLKFSDLMLALQHLELCDNVIDKLRQQSSNESDKISIGIIANEVYADGVRIASYMSDVAFRNKNLYREKAFYFAEKSKSAVLSEAISDVQAKSFAGIPPAFLEEEQQLKSSIALCSQKLSQKPTPEEETYLREALFTLNMHYQTFIENLEKTYPDYFNLKFNTATPAVKDLQKKLDNQSAMLSYFIDDSKVNNPTRIYVFALTENKLTVDSRILPKDFDRLLTGFRNAIYYNEPVTLNKIGFQLHQILIPKLPKSIKSLIIFPTGRLGVIPFEALLTKKYNSRQKGVHYLVSKYATRYEFSASLILQKNKKEISQSQAMLLCAPIQFQENDNLAELPGTELEVKNIAALFNKFNLQTTTLTWKNASEESIKTKSLQNYRFIHLATHGVVDEKNPSLSRIYLQKEHDAEDGHLYSAEIYSLKLQADLVTLSACQTGLGKISKGEGVIGLSRALTYAGAQNIIVSYWSVADESTAQLMTDFYSYHLNNNASFSKSLQTVKLQMLNDKNYAAPYYWAPFVLIGF